MEFKLLEVSKFTTYLRNYRGAPIFFIQKSKLNDTLHRSCSFFYSIQKYRLMRKYC